MVFEFYSVIYALCLCVCHDAFGCAIVTKTGGDVPQFLCVRVYKCSPVNRLLMHEHVCIWKTMKVN